MNTGLNPELQSKLELLDSGIRRLVAVLKETRRENAQLRANLEDLKNQMISMQLKTGQAEQALADAEQYKTEIMELRTTRDQVTRKIESLLRQIDELQMELETG